MPLNFTPTSVVKSAARKFTVPITSAATFDANIAALKAAENPLGAVDYQTSGETEDAVAITKEYYKATVDYLTPLGKVIGSILVTAPSRAAYDAVIASLLANTTLTEQFGEGTIADRNTTKDAWNVRVRIHDPTGENYFLTFTRKDLQISSYENDAILTKVDTWADGVTSLN